MPELMPADLRRLRERRGQREQHEQRKIGGRKAERQAEARTYAPAHELLIRIVDLIEDAAVGEVLLLRFTPTAEAVDVDQFHLGELIGVTLRDRGEARTEVVPRNDVLARRGVQKIQIRLGDGRSSSLCANR